MPKYQVYCADCNEEYEIEKSYTDTTPFSCPKGHTNRIVNKIRQSAPIIYKGDGFVGKIGKSNGE